MSNDVAGPDGSGLSEGLGPLVERLLKYSDIRRNDPRENREALRDLIVGELADELRAVRAAERERWLSEVRRIAIRERDKRSDARMPANEVLNELARFGGRQWANRA